MCDRLPLSLSLVLFSPFLLLPLRVLLLWSASKRRQKNAYISIEKEREKKIRDWSSPMIGRELIVLCNFQTNNRERERRVQHAIFYSLLVNTCIHFYTTNERRKKKRNLSITCLVFLYHKRGRQIDDNSHSPLEKKRIDREREGEPTDTLSSSFFCAILSF